MEAEARHERRKPSEGYREQGTFIGVNGIKTQWCSCVPARMRYINFIRRNGYEHYDFERQQSKHRH